MGKAAYNDPKRRASYEDGAEMYHRLFLWYLANRPGPPRFAMLPPDVALLGSLDDGNLGYKLARNESAHELIDTFLELSSRLKIEPPTYMMLRAFVHVAGLETDSVSIADLGLRVVGTPGPILRN